MLEDKDNQTVEDFEIVEAGTVAAQNAADEQANDDEDSDGDEGDTRTSDDEGDRRLVNADEREQRGFTNAEKRKMRRKHLKEKLDQKDGLIRSLQQQVRQQNDRMTAQENRSSVHERAMIEKALMDAKDNAMAAKRQYADSLTTGDAAMVADANEIMYTTRRRVEELEGAKQRIESIPRQQAGGINANVQRNTSSWMGRNTWFDPSGDDEDSLICKTLDNKIAAEGFDPGTPEYWAELDRRIARRLPHRSRNRRSDFEDEGDDRQSQSQQVRQAGNVAEERQARTRTEPRQTVGSSGQSSGGDGNKRVKVTLSKERIQAIKDSGNWDNQTERNKMIKNYMQWDRDNAATA